MARKPNDDLRALQAALVKLHGKLNASLDDVSDPDAMEAIVREMQEVTHRIGLVGQLLFAKQAASLADKVAEVGRATRRANAAIKDMQNVAQFLDAMNDLLTVVDEAIQIAKVLAI
jgi:hypothetical protein